jgi:hypothetical protein
VTDAEGAPSPPPYHSFNPQEPGASDDTALAASTASSGDNKLQGGGANKWSLESITNWEFWWPGFPVLVYYKENQTRPEGQPHFFPIIMVLLNMPKAAVPLDFSVCCSRCSSACWFDRPGYLSSSLGCCCCCRGIVVAGGSDRFPCTFRLRKVVIASCVTRA